MRKEGERALKSPAGNVATTWHNRSGVQAPVYKALDQRLWRGNALGLDGEGNVLPSAKLEVTSGGCSGQEERSHRQAYAGIVLSPPLWPLWKPAPYPSTPGPGCAPCLPHLKSRQTTTRHLVFGHLALWGTEKQCGVIK